MRLAGTLLIATLVAASNACDPGGEEHITITYENNTTSLICEYHGTAASPREPRDECQTPIKPMTTTMSVRECFTIDLGASDIVLIEQSEGEVVYARVANCRKWLDSGARITIDKQGDEFIVTDGFPDE